MLFRDGLYTSFPRKKVSEEQIQFAQQRGKQLKQEIEVKKIHQSTDRHQILILVITF